ncbi:transposase [Nonomuraea polychroma]|uniref:transposase n=1 Tax=Nonomuraea polychroma TaxID=46176 RepID=UPI000FDF1254|nr:transposase [Nonomuraea polychroma]
MISTGGSRPGAASPRTVGCRVGVRPPAAARVVAGQEAIGRARGFNGIVWKLRTGTACRDVPKRYGPWATPHTRFRRWALDGTSERMLQAAQPRADEAGDIDWLMSVDPTVARAHQHAAAARKGSAVSHSDAPEAG